MSEPRHDNNLRAFPFLKPTGFLGCLILLASFFLPTAKTQAQMVVADTVYTEVIPTVKAHNPTKALLLSIIPGAGQIYNGQAWKLPIVYGALGGVGYFTYTYYKSMKSFKDEYLSRCYKGSDLEGQYLFFTLDDRITDREFSESYASMRAWRFGNCSR